MAVAEGVATQHTHRFPAQAVQETPLPALRVSEELERVDVLPELQVVSPVAQLVLTVQAAAAQDLQAAAAEVDNQAQLPADTDAPAHSATEVTVAAPALFVVVQPAALTAAAVAAAVTMAVVVE